MDKTVKNAVGKVMKEGEKVAPVKSIKLKVKFQKPSDSRSTSDGKLASGKKK